MPAGNKRIYHLLFATTVVGLTVFKWHDLHLPYFWDELGVYTQAADYQFHHHLSLMPSSVPPLLSRGHPLLFTFINAIVMRLSGESIFVSHLFCFFISMLLLAAVYVKISRYFDPLTGILSAVILAVQPLFLAQCGLVLPEILLALFIFLALCSYYQNRFWQFALFASLAILTKEAGVVLPCTVMGYSICKWVLVKIKPRGLQTVNLVLSVAPYLVFGFFLLLQKLQNGWYFFPLHINSVAFNTGKCLAKLALFKCFIFNMQGRGSLSCIIIAGAAISLFFNKYSLRRMGSSFILMLLLFALAFAMLSSLIDLYMERYILALLIVFSVMAAAAVTTITKNRWLVAVVIILLLGIASQNLENGNFNYDADLGYRKAVTTLQQGVNNVVQIAAPGSSVYSYFPGYYAFTFPAGGYISAYNAGRLKFDKSALNYYLLLVNPGDPFQVDTSQFSITLLKKSTNGYASAEVYWVEKKATPAKRIN